MDAEPTTRDQLVRRLDQYWRLEMANAVLIPMVIVVLAATIGFRLGAPTLLAAVATVVLLILGGLYCRAKLHRLTGRPESLRRLLPHLARWQWISAALTVASIGLAVGAWVAPELSAGVGDRVIASICAALAALEYVNYYHRQLQHFDHRPDLQRLISGNGFRRAQLANDLQRWRAHRR